MNIAEQPKFVNNERNGPNVGNMNGVNKALGRSGPSNGLQKFINLVRKRTVAALQAHLHRMYAHLTCGGRLLSVIEVQCDTF